MKLKQETIWTYRQLAETDLAFFMDMPADIFSKTHVYISESNTKTGNTPSVSLLPIETCGNCDGCARYCYAVRMALRFPAVRMSWARNTAILRREPARFWAEVRQYIERKQPPAFRFNVGGEIPDLSYLHDMNTTARMFPSVQFWTYTKMHDIVNMYMDAANIDLLPALSDNLSIMFSVGMQCGECNKYGMPEFRFIPSGAPLPAGTHVCGGHCRACLDGRTGCPYGQSSVVKEH